MSPRQRSRRLASLAAGLLIGAGWIVAQPGPAQAAPFQRGDVFLSGSGFVPGAPGIQAYSPSGQLVQTVPGTSGSNALCFDPSGAHLILPGVGLFDSSGNPLPSHWASVSGAAHCVADRLGDVYVSGGSTTSFQKYDLNGDPLQTFTVPPTFGDGLAIDLAPDGCTIYYGSWNETPPAGAGAPTGIGRFDACTGTQLPAFSSEPFTDDLRVLPDSEVLVTADAAGGLEDVSGQFVRGYSPGPPVGDHLRFMSLDPDGKSFWMSGLGVVRYDIATGKLLSEWGISPSGSATAGGPIAVYPGASSSPPIPSPGPTPPTITTGTPPLPAPTDGVGAPTAGPGSETVSGAGVAVPSQYEIRTLLETALSRCARTAKVAALASRGGCSFRWTAPSAGRLLISWYLVPAGAHLSAKRAPIPVATVGRSFSQSKTVTLTVALTRHGRQVLKRGTPIKLTAKGSFTPRGGRTTSALESFTLTR